MKLFTGLLLIVILGFGQKQARMGVTAGVGIYTMTAEDDQDELDSRVGFQFGGIADFEKFFITAKYDSKVVGKKEGSVETTLRFSYLSLSPRYKMNLDNSYLFIGPTLDINLSATGKIENGSIFIENDIENVNSLRIGGVIGFGFKANDNLDIVLNYNLGFSNTSDEDIESKFSGFEANLVFFF